MAVNLVKGQKVSLVKSNGTALTNFCVGCNWSAIVEKGFFGNKKIPVDLDLSAGIFDSNKQLLGVIYFQQLIGPGIKHSGDDRVGDIDGDDGLDNEVISISLPDLPQDVNQIVFLLNSFTQIDFEKIPFASVRLYEGTPTKVNSVFAEYKINTDSKFIGKVSLILGKLYKRNNEWKFSAIGETTSDKELGKAIESAKSYL
jgi:tellurium resistance protein TerZ